ncbi:hypothetical protein AAV35_012610 [Salimicrobium jeotgali]|uniref:Uncharacterized protein n=1 Tax=Salimicrobium jeotgali TaxID=1230341 RepID=K2GJ62_9BACI|nr:hypothetical protein [Salimicrobium jeotgali]AKG05512.1 hypothetical protein AAV35_012610 [Salimicrobium jeotgali]EKE30504.1 hypothetical protein MJ3_13724 [Salimicrobium jeotgali]MBM7696653.1 hypothetical protein [Salimicrobium jeotgali]
MLDEKEMEEMPIWQDHERRITTLENTFTTFSSKVDGVEKTIKDQGDKQEKLLNNLIDHHLSTKKMRISKFWQVILNLTGAGSIVTGLIYAITQLIQGG